MKAETKEGHAIKLLIAAMGGEGGGVLTSWIVGAAREAGLPVQATSIPGVAQRTGATTYYIEMWSKPLIKGSSSPVFSLAPAPGEVDILVATELAEAGRMVAAGYVTPDRTTLLASCHRVYTTGEKMAMGDGRADVDCLLEGAEVRAKVATFIDMKGVALETGAVINAIVLGAISEIAVLPISTQILKGAIESEGKSVELNLSGFDAGSAAVQVGQDKSNPSPLVFDKEVLGQLPDLKVISKFGVGLNNIDTNAMKDKSIALGFKPGTNKQSVAELALMHVLIALRNLSSSKENITNNQWSQAKGNELLGKTIGIVGFGNIGQRLSALLEPFNCKILFFDSINFSNEDLNSIYQDKSETFLSNIHQKSLHELLSESEIISIHIPLLAETENLIDIDEFSLMKEDVNIINTSRGGIVNEKALETFLIKNKRAFAGFDVFKTEPAFNHPLLELENFYATSHLGSMTIEGVIAMGMAAINGLDENSIPL